MTIQRIVFAIAYTHYLGTGRLITKEQVADVLAVPQSENHRFKLATEEYLHALVSLVNELSRLAVNSVTLGDFGTPVRLSAFVKDLHTGFQMLNLKNDSLRKRFDSIKYDVKKIEEVVYDISLRGLAGSGPPNGVGTEVDDVEADRVLSLLRN
ncbi:hypothetical protein L7F22_038983 [Adiantum nelumboides]|nr:hypothetical protein [Adiantum nelumboides]